MPTAHERFSIGPNHRRCISTSLTLLDEALCQFEQWAHGTSTSSVLYRRQNRLSSPQRQEILTQVQRARAVLGKLRRDLRLECRVHDAARDISARCATLWQDLVELDAEHLRAYGQVPAGLGAYLRPHTTELIDILERVSQAVRETAGPADPDVSAGTQGDGHVGQGQGGPGQE